ncbi:MAG: hypothetical protein IT254_08005 [Chitinophagaceae bacterium]|nr:hypothetical protein [Bacteroidota bacterium]MCC6258249.1 hypothetical protein [Chitinophagaceae bacterium]MCW5916580.1 hypothetical protein [Ferruginibacter sp.]
MKGIYILLLFSFFLEDNVFCQNKDLPIDSSRNITVIKDPRIDLLGKEMAKYNESLAEKMRSTKGYRLMVMNSSNRSEVMKVRQQLLQMFPEQSVYIVFQSPYMKLKFGNFLEKGEAEDYRKIISAAQLVNGNIYIVPEMIEIRADKLNQAQAGDP